MIEPGSEALEPNSNSNDRARTWTLTIEPESQSEPLGPNLNSHERTRTQTLMSEPEPS